MIYQSYTNSHPIHVSFLVSVENEKSRHGKNFSRHTESSLFGSFAATLSRDVIKF